MVCGVLMVNHNAEEIVLPSFTCVGKPVSAVSVALSGSSGRHCHGYHHSLGEAGRLFRRSLLHRYEHVFPAPGEPVTGLQSDTIPFINLF